MWTQMWAKVAVLAATSRLAFCSLAVASDWWLEDYDSSATALTNQPDSLLERFAKPFLRWDAFYFAHISEHGYVYEQEHAFFPLLPLLTRPIAHGLQLWLGLDGPYAYVITGSILSNIFFVLAAILLFRLSEIVLKDQTRAFVACVLFCLSPAGLFLSSMYSESLFALLSFGGMYLFQQKRWVAAAIVFGISSSARSNGLLYGGFFAYAAFQACFHEKSQIALQRVILALLCLLVSAAGMIAFQAFGYLTFCGNDGLERPWCRQTIPQLYSFVQDHYWNVGLFRYYEIKQLPNFLLAAPTLIFSLAAIRSYALRRPDLIWSVGVIDKSRGFFSRETFPYVVLWAVMLVYAVLIVHIQIVTRLFTCLPMMNWAGAEILCRSTTDSRRWGRVWLTYAIVYASITTVLFSNFYPPA